MTTTIIVNRIASKITFFFMIMILTNISIIGEEKNVIEMSEEKRRMSELNFVGGPFKL